MKITVFTSNQPRHIAYINKLSKIADSVFAVVETGTIFPGAVSDFFQKTEVMQRYFAKVLAAELSIFPDHAFPDRNVRIKPIRRGDLNLMNREQLSVALESDYYLVFGSSYIKGWLSDFLCQSRALNIHMGLSPYYRGSSCNFWALYDSHPNYVGATVHYLTKGLDSGPMLFHSIPSFSGQTPFEYSMSAVDKVQDDLVERIADDNLPLHALEQRKDLEVRYSRNVEFNDQVAMDFLSRDLSPSKLEKDLQDTHKPPFLILDV